MNKLYEILMDDDVVSSIKNNLDYLLEIIPEINDMIGFDQMHPHHHLDVFEHTLFALSMSPKDFEIRISLLLHDIGKPHSYQEIDGVRHFKGHASKSCDMAFQILNRLDISEDLTYEICYLINYHDTPITKEDILNNYDLAIKRYEIQKCDALAHHPEKLEKRINYLDRTKKLITQLKV